MAFYLLYLIILDRKNIINSVAVMKLQLLLMQALYVLIKKNHSGEYQNELLHSSFFKHINFLRKKNSSQINYSSTICCKFIFIH